MSTQFYTYLHCRPDGMPFYVGKGHGKRAYRLHREENTHHQRIVAKHNAHNIQVFIFPCDTEQQALADEIQQIAQLRREGYTLCNQTNGGDGSSGYTHTPGARAKMSVAKKGRKHSAENIAKRVAALIGRKRPPEVGRKVSASKKGKPRPDMIGNKFNVGRKLSSEHRAKVSTSLIGNKRALGRIMSAEERASRSGRKQTAEEKKQRSISCKAAWIMRKGKIS
ncbi:MAG: NUMOD3 domain-containing DNA-binding protein [Gallionella sp.]